MTVFEPSEPFASCVVGGFAQGGWVLCKFDQLIYYSPPSPQPLSLGRFYP